MTNRIPWGPDSPGYPNCPVPAGHDVTVWSRDGGLAHNTAPEDWSWDHCGDGADIIAYCDHDAQDEAAEADTMRYMREIAQNLGYPSVLEALEACPPNEAQADGQDQARELLEWARAYVNDCPASATPSPERVDLLARIDAYLERKQ